MYVSKIIILPLKFKPRKIDSEIFRLLKSNEVINDKNSIVEICQRFCLIYKATFSGFSKVNTQTEICTYLSS